MIPITVFNEVAAHRQRLFVWGWTTYRDVFWRTPTRLSEFCTEISNVTGGLSDPATANSINWQTNACRTHNCYDEDCVDYQGKTKGK